MLARLLGAIASTAASAPVPAVSGSLSKRTVAGGYVAFDAALDVHEQTGSICIACGTPRFQGREHAAIAREQGAAAGWRAAFAAAGDRAPAHVHGRYSVILVESAARTVTMATDRFATWSLCVAARADALFFAERADQVPVPRREISPQAIFDYLFFHVIPAPATIFAGIRRLPPASVLTWRDGAMECRSYWTPKFAAKTRADLVASEREFLALVERSVVLEAGENRVGAYLSGGTDSSTVAGMLCKVQGGPAKTYSMGFEAAGYDEMHYARIAARHFGAEHHEYYVTPQDLLGGVPKIAIHYDQPFGNSSALPSWICAQRAAEDGVEKMLAGDGGDELFGGNVRYATQKVFGWYGDSPALVRSLLLDPLAKVPGVARIPLLSKAASYVRQARVPMPDRLQSYNLLQRIGEQEIFEPGFLAGIDRAGPRKLEREVWEGIEARSLVDRMLALDWRFTLSDNDLPKVIGTAQLANVDVGFPLMSDELLDFSMTLPPEWKVKGLKLRWFFKHALRDFLPRAIIDKKKHGFGLPFGVWAWQHPALMSQAQSALRDFAKRAVVRSDFTERLIDVYMPAHPRFYGEMAWILMMLELWLQQHAPDWRFAG